MVGLTRPRQRATRRPSGDDFLPSTSRSLSPHSHRRGRLRGAANNTNNSKKSKLPLLMPLLIFLGVFWIGLHAGGPDDDANHQLTHLIHDNRGSRLVVDPEDPTITAVNAIPNSNNRQQPIVAAEPGVGGGLRGNNINNDNFPVHNGGLDKFKEIDAMTEGHESKPDTEREREPKDDNPVADDDKGDPERSFPELDQQQHHDDHNYEHDPGVANEKPLNVEPGQQEIQTKAAAAAAAAEAAATEAPNNNNINNRQTKQTNPPNVVSIYLEPRNTLDEGTRPLPRRQTAANLLEHVEYPNIQSCHDIPHRLPINDFPERDPFLPWIHDYFVSSDGQSVQFVAQNKRRCHTGEGKEIPMAYWQAQVSLFQPVPVTRIRHDENTTDSTNITISKERYRLASPGDVDVIAPETRFQCRFHTANDKEEWITFSEYTFNYEYIVWRKRGDAPMFVEMGPDVDQAELSQLTFGCPIPEALKAAKTSTGGSRAAASFWIDIIPIRTPPRKTTLLLTSNHTGPDEIMQVNTFDAEKSFGVEHVLPLPEDAGRWANLPVCMETNKAASSPKPHTLVACTWAAASYKRRGDETLITDAALRLREWIHFNRLVGMDHVYLYDNTQLSNTTAISPLQEVVDREFKDYVTYIPWPALECNNHKSNGKVPGERSSQFAAEASCIQRFGPLTEWMTFLDVDEYMIPRNNPLDWKPILNTRKEQGHSILSLRSTRGRPRLELMDELPDTSICETTKKHLRRADSTCIGPRSNETLLRVYNCDGNPPPRPDRFDKSKKQIIRPAFVLQHMVHNTTVTKSLATYYEDYSDNNNNNKTSFTRELAIPEDFLNEMTEGFMVHAKTLPSPGMLTRSHNCQLGSSALCLVGYVCSAATAVNDTLLSKNLLEDNANGGNFCNCWVNEHVEQVIVPQLEAALRQP